MIRCHFPVPIAQMVARGFQRTRDPRKRWKKAWYGYIQGQHQGEKEMGEGATKEDIQHSKSDKGERKEKTERKDGKRTQKRLAREQARKNRLEIVSGCKIRKKTQEMNTGK